MGPCVRAASCALLASFLTSFACGASKSDCTCAVDYNGERRTLACGETSCVGGAVTACGSDGQTAQRGPCTSTPEPPGPSGEDDAGATEPPDTSCDDLRAFCDTSCSNPPDVSADCQETASSGDPQTCASWQLSNGFLCKP